MDWLTIQCVEIHYKNDIEDEQSSLSKERKVEIMRSIASDFGLSYKVVEEIIDNMLDRLIPTVSF